MKAAGKKTAKVLPGSDPAMATPRKNQVCSHVFRMRLAAVNMYQNVFGGSSGGGSDNIARLQLEATRTLCEIQAQKVRMLFACVTLLTFRRQASASQLGWVRSKRP
jgi:hypothetical protein